MGKENIIQTKSYAFSLRVIKLFIYLKDEKKEFILSKQLLRSATSIGANVEEAIGGQSKKDFISKLAIAYKESRETHYWLRLLKDAGFLKEDLALSFIEDCEELIKILTSIINSTKSNS